MLGESLLTLAALAGQMVVDAAATDAWETAEHRYAKLLGRGDAKQTQLAEQRLAGLAPEQLILALPLEVLRVLPEEYLRSLPAEVQERVRKRLQGTAH